MRHVPPDRALSNAIFFISFNVLNREPRFLTVTSAQLIVDALQFYRQRGDIELYGWVIMPDHIDLLVRVNSAGTATSWTRRFKSYTTHAFGKKPLWQHGFWSELVVTGEFFLRKLEYIHSNPVRKGLSEIPDEFRWSSAREYAEGKFTSITPHWDIEHPLAHS